MENKMKYVVILGDGMADEPREELGGKTPLAYAKTPMLDELAVKSEIGMAKTIPDGMKPGSDTANLAVMGYDPKRYYTGRSPLEALSIGVQMRDTDVAIRCNLVTLSDDDLPYAEKTIIDHSSDEISTEDADVLLKAVKEAFEDETYQFYTGTSYRHLLIWNCGRVVELTPPHDVLGRVIGEYLPEEEGLRRMMEKSYEVLNHHPLNEERAKKGLHKANSIWFWGAGTKPCVTSFCEKTGLTGTMISAVDLLKGIAVGAGMETAQVPGANGGLHTNYEGKAQAALKAMLDGGSDFAYIHLEGPDEMGHQGKCDDKVLSIEYLDSRIVKPVCEGLRAAGEDFRLLVMPDHPTPVRLRTHTDAPVPYMLYDSRKNLGTGLLYNEEDAPKSGIMIVEGYTLMDRLLER